MHIDTFKSSRQSRWVKQSWNELFVSCQHIINIVVSDCKSTWNRRWRASLVLQSQRKKRRRRMQICIIYCIYLTWHDMSFNIFLRFEKQFIGIRFDDRRLEAARIVDAGFASRHLICSTSPRCNYSSFSSFDRDTKSHFKMINSIIHEQFHIATLINK